MLSLFAKFVLTGTSVVPVIVVYAILFCIAGEYVVVIILATASIALAFSGWAILKVAREKELENLGAISFKSAENADNSNLGVLLIYLVPLISTSVSEMSWLSAIPAAVIFLALTISGRGFHFNPLLNILGWRFYKITTQEGVTYLLITQKNIRNTANPIIVGQLTEYTLVDLE